MSRLSVILAALFILAAGGYGALRGYAFTDLDSGPPESPQIVTSVAAAPAAPPVPLGIGYDERAIRELARGEVRGVIRQHLAAATTAQPDPEPSTETPSSETLAPSEPTDDATDTEAAT